MSKRKQLRNTLRYLRRRYAKHDPLLPIVLRNARVIFRDRRKPLTF